MAANDVPNSETPPVVNEGVKDAAKKTAGGLWTATKGHAGDLLLKAERNKIAGVAVPLAATAAAAWLLPDKEVTVTREDGTEDTVKKSGGFKKAAVTVGAIATAGGIASHFKPVQEAAKSWVAKAAESKLAAVVKGI